MAKFIMKNSVRERRTLLNLSQTDLANSVGCSRNTISSIERGEFEPTAFTAGLICRALLCSFEDLFFFERPNDTLIKWVYFPGGCRGYCRVCGQHVFYYASGPFFAPSRDNWCIEDCKCSPVPAFDLDDFPAHYDINTQHRLD